MLAGECFTYKLFVEFLRFEGVILDLGKVALYQLSYSRF